VGSTAGYHNNVREEHLDYLNYYGIDVYRAGGLREHFISIDKYTEILRRSRISLNFSHSALGTHQVKGRVFESLFSGALLMENDNEETKRFFTPMVDYVTFESKDDLVDKVRYYLEHEDERQRIAMNGHLKATREYNTRVFWSKVMERLGELKLLRPSATST
jgi:spore maturation protein CgeB